MIEQDHNAESARSRKSTRAALAITAVCVLVIAGAFGLIVRAQRTTSSATTIAEAQSERVLITVEGMHCGGCASGIKAMLKRTPGVISAEVSFEKREANVEFDPGRTSREKIVETITNMGYKARIKG